MSRAVLFPLAVALALALTGCGKKPKTVDPPQGWDANTFPHTYPDPNPGQAAKKVGKGDTGPNLGAPNAGTDPKDAQDLPVPTIGGMRFP